jgi:hypothetical protein
MRKDTDTLTMILHNNAHPHTAANTAKTCKKLNFKVLEHCSYDSDLAPSDYNLFCSTEEALRCHQCAMDKQLNETMHT